MVTPGPSLKDVLRDPEHWLTWGMRKGWVSPPWCWTHDLPTLLDEEIEALGDEGDDMPCIPVIRLNARAAESHDEREDT